MEGDFGSQYKTGVEYCSEDDIVNMIDFDCSVEEKGEAEQTVKGDCPKLEVGMKFGSSQELYETYNTYAFKNGFGIRRRNVRKNYIFITCSRNGYNSTAKTTAKIEKNSRMSSTGRCGCLAALSATRCEDSVSWRITKFVDVHNHEMVSPKSVPLLRSHKVYSVAAKALTEAFSRVGVAISRVPHVLGPSEVPSDVRDCYNHMKKIRNIIYEAGDAQAVQLYCTQQHEVDPNFFYSIQFDDESRMLNFFWVDSRSRAAYEQFGDVITFDTTYRTNKYAMLFAPFVGLNHHMQTILFGCALLHDETEETFCWLFQTWLTAMKGKMPKGIITDQDAAMGNAIRRIFPDTRHRLCLWHISKKFPEKLSHVYQENSRFKSEFNDVIYNSKTIEKFEQGWIQVMNIYQIHGNDWLRGLYNILSTWVPVYNVNFFWAGMSTTQRSESINSFFNNFVHSGMTLREFVTKFDIAINTRYETYKKEEFESIHKERRLTLNMCIEEHAALVYTRNVFTKFHEELVGSLVLSKEKIMKNGATSIYKVWNRKDSRDDHAVHIDFQVMTCDCTCKKFQFIGILCRHVLCIFHAKSIDRIPHSYILQRWKKQGNKLHSIRICHDNLGGWHHQLRSFGLNVMVQRLYELSDQSEKAYQYIQDAIISVLSSAEDIAKVDPMYYGPNIRPENDVELGISTLNFLLKDPPISSTKGRKRLKGGLELTGKQTNICGTCGKRGHNKRSCKITT